MNQVVLKNVHPYLFVNPYAALVLAVPAAQVLLIAPYSDIWRMNPYVMCILM